MKTNVLLILYASKYISSQTTIVQPSQNWLKVSKTVRNGCSSHRVFNGLWFHTFYDHCQEKYSYFFSFSLVFIRWFREKGPIHLIRKLKMHHTILDHTYFGYNTLLDYRFCRDNHRFSEDTSPSPTMKTSHGQSGF